MPVCVVDHRGGPPTAVHERSPLVALETDAASTDELPESIRAAADSISLGKLSSVRLDRVPHGSDGVITWFAGDRFLQGSAASIRCDLRTPGRRCFVPVHFPYMAELDLLAIQPRWLSGGHMKDFWSTAARIMSSSPASEKVHTAFKVIDLPWVQLSQAILAEQAGPGTGIQTLARLAQEKRTPPQVSALALRNLVVALMKHKDIAKAEQVLEGAFKAYPDYAELYFVGALLALHQHKKPKALGYLERARSANHQFVGSGGENSYRAAWLLGRLAAEVGNQRVAFENFYQGMVSRPVFTPAVDDLLNLRLSPALVEKHQYDFTRLVRREPKYLSPVFDYLLLHRAFPAARRIVETMSLDQEARDTLLRKLASVETPFRPGASRDGKPGILLSGPFFEHSSFARINRELAAELVQSTEFDAALEPCCQPLLLPQKVTDGSLIMTGLLRHPKHLDLTIRHQWPPDFQRPPRGKLAVILPWEYGAVPRVWVREIERNVDELWVPSYFVRDVFVRAGVSEHRVQVIPNGIDPRVFKPDGPSSRPHGCRSFLFLFVGGAILRKGIDVVLEAYAEAFEAGDDVTLLVSAAAQPAYVHNSCGPLLAEFMGNPRLPHLVVISEQLDDATLATLYRGCDAFVAPYRGEGFGMPIAEAMACGKSVIATAAGPAPEFCPADCGYLIPARETEVPDAPPPFGEFVGNWTWFEPDVGALARAMRHVYEHRDEAAQRGQKAARTIRQAHTWDRVRAAYVQRIADLVACKPVRSGSIERHMEESACRESLCP